MTESALPGPRSILATESARTPVARLGVAVVRDLVGAIVTGEVAPGDSLPPEGVLSQHFGVSRTVIRESVKRVEEKGLLAVTQGRGTSVNDPSSWNVLDPVVLSALVEHDDSLGVLDELAIVRGSLEGSMAAAAARGRTPERALALQSAMDRMTETIDDYDTFSKADVDFHFTVMDQSENRLATNITRILFLRASESSRFVGNPTTEAVRLTLDEHRAVHEAIERGDPDAAERAMRTHISEAWARRRPRREAP